MDGGDITVTRALPIDGALVGDVLLRLRRDTPRSAASWTLGSLGAVEIDTRFSRATSDAALDITDGALWATTGRLWDCDAIAVVPVVVELTAVANDACRLTLRPEAERSPWWSARQPALAQLAAAALDELAEELLWHASRPGLDPREAR